VLEAPLLGGKMVNVKLAQPKAEELLKVLLRVPDCRGRRGIRHDQTALLALAICAVLGGARSFVAIAEWAQRCSQNQLRRLGFRRNARSGRYQAPSEPTIRRLLQGIDAEQVDRVVSDWLLSLCPSRPEAVALDGKTLRGARKGRGHQVHLLSAILQGEGVVVAQREVRDKSNEIPEATVLLEPLPLAGTVVTADALHTQKKLARWLVKEKKADYCLTVKNNQPTLKRDIAELFESESFPPGA
jgi:DDE_Tnp_1-associated/Transposase DDE domain